MPPLLQDLALILASGAIAGIICRWLKQPVVLGYLLAGFLISPHVPLFPSLRDTEGINVWAEAGVIFLLFGLGLEFSFKKLLRVGTPATVAALFEVVFMLAIGYGLGQAFGWSSMDSLFLGGVLSVSSTTIIIRAFDELGMKQRGFASLVFGVLIVEDLIAILLLVMLSTVAVTRTFEGGELVVSFLKLGFFLVLWFVGGIFFVPSLLRKLRGQLSSEAMVILSIGMCLAMVYLATVAGFSPALGAFIMGSILAETREAERIEHLTKPVQDLFGAVFFVSVGMLIDPKSIVEFAGPILLIGIATVVGKLISSGSGALVAGRSLRHSLQAGMSLAQIGEFSFIIATLGLTLKVTSESLYPIVVAVSALTTFTTPYMIKFSDPLSSAIEASLSPRVKNALMRYQASFQTAQELPEWRYRLRSYLIRMVLNGVVIVAIFLGLEQIYPNYVDSMPIPVEWSTWFMAFIAIVLSGPFIWAMAIGGSGNSDERERLSLEAVKTPRFVIELLRIAAAAVLVAILSARLTNLVTGFVIALTVVIVTVFIASRRLQRSYQWLEQRFLGNLTDRETGDKTRLAPWDAHLIELEVQSNSLASGKTLEELAIREQFGVSIAMIERGSRKIFAPGRGERIFPGDQLGVIRNRRSNYKIQRSAAGR